MPTTATSRVHQPGTFSLARGGVLHWQARPLIMGVLNITPDSFSDGGQWMNPDAAVQRARQMVAQGADMLDLGAESTRPGGGVYGSGAEFVPAQEELRRLLPVLESLRDQVSVPISVDTRKGSVARAALGAGADLINDISALSDPTLAAAVAEAGCPVVLMHSRGVLASMQEDITFDDVVAEVIRELESDVERALEFGIRRRCVLIDPGIGFGKTASQNLELLRHLDDLAVLDLPVLVGASRKSFIADVVPSGAPDRLAGSLAAVAWAAHHPAVTAPIMGARNIEQLKDSLKSADIEMSPDLYNEICRLTPTPPPATDRSENRVED